MGEMGNPGSMQYVTHPWRGAARSCRRRRDPRYFWEDACILGQGWPWGVYYICHRPVAGSPPSKFIYAGLPEVGPSPSQIAQWEIVMNIRVLIEQPLGSGSNGWLLWTPTDRLRRLRRLWAPPAPLPKDGLSDF